MLYRKVAKGNPARDVLVPGPKLIAANEEVDEWLEQYNAHFSTAVKFQVPSLPPSCPFR